MVTILGTFSTFTGFAVAELFELDYTRLPFGSTVLITEL